METPGWLGEVTLKKRSKSQELKFDQRCLITTDLYMESEPRLKADTFYQLTDT